MSVRLQQTLYPEGFLGGDMVEKFHRKLNYEKGNVCPKNLSSVQRHLLGQLVFRESPEGLSEPKRKQLSKVVRDGFP